MDFITHQELLKNARGLVIAATAICGMTFHIAHAPEVLSQLDARVRGSLRSEDNVNTRSLGSLPYLKVCIEETLHHSMRNFADPGTFAPQRWLRDLHALRACKSFAARPRHCIDKTPAYAEMRLMPSRMICKL
ncbi:hypothetical protein PspLS_08216 [Pyricularia sp. CBS 133598]|nr:hypothetical protein PspLS_08216 [Pyricularia sp. CBS 133598]